MKNIKLIACDMDGTLLNDEKIITPANIEAVARLKDAGIYFVIATGRHDSMIKNYLDELGIEMPVISCNGALVRDPFADKLYSTIPIELESIRTTIEICKSHGADYHLYTRDIIFGETLTNRMEYYYELNKSLPGREKVHLYVSNDYQQFINEQKETLLKVLIIPNAPEDAKKIGADILKDTGLILYQSAETLFDLMQKGVNKAQALEALCTKLGIKQEECAALGDQSNDMEMLEYAGIGIAMANAQDSVKNIAQIVTRKGNNQSGVAEAIDMILAAQSS